MLPNIRNQQTISILNKLKEQGPPSQGQIGSVSLDMTMPENDSSGQENLLQPIQDSNNGAGKPKKKLIPQNSTGT